MTPPGREAAPPRTEGSYDVADEYRGFSGWTVTTKSEPGSTFRPDVAVISSGKKHAQVVEPVKRKLRQMVDEGEIRRPRFVRGIHNGKRFTEFICSVRPANEGESEFSELVGELLRLTWKGIGILFRALKFFATRESYLAEFARHYGRDDPLGIYSLTMNASRWWNSLRANC